MGYKKVVFNGIEYQLTPKWYKAYLSAIEILKRDKEINTDELDVSELVDIRDVKIDSKKPYLIIVGEEGDSLIDLNLSSYYTHSIYIHTHNVLFFFIQMKKLWKTDS